MKALLKLIIIPALAALAVVGCGDKDKKNSNPYANNPAWNQPFGPGGVSGYQFRGLVSLSDQSLYQQYLEENGLCSRDAFIIGTINTCKQIDGSPFIALSFQSAQYSDSWGLPAQVILNVISDYSWGTNAPVSQQANQTTFYRINNNEMLEADVYTYTGQLRIQMTGLPTDNQISVSVSYRGRPMGTATLGRIPSYNYGYPQPGYPQQPYQPGYPNQYPYGY